VSVIQQMWVEDGMCITLRRFAASWICDCPYSHVISLMVPGWSDDANTWRC